VPVMSRKPTGNAYLSAGRWYGRVTLAHKVRRSFALLTCSTQPEADSRASLLSDLAQSLRSLNALDLTTEFVSWAAVAEDPAQVVEAASLVIKSGNVRPASTKPSFAEVARQWLSGEIARLHPDHVRTIKKVNDQGRNVRYLAATIGNMPVDQITIDSALQAMSNLPKTLGANTRRAVGGTLYRVMSLAAWPLRLIASNPIPRGFLPRGGERRAKSFLYPQEDARLLACVDVPLGRRVFYGFMAREGTRPEEALAMERSDFNFDVGSVRLEKNKTRDPRTWALDRATVRALAAWFALDPDERFAFPDITLNSVARTLRADLLRAGVTRAELHTSTETRRRMRGHDLRATFVTIKLATGKTEDWVSRRTGHRSTAQIALYRRDAATVEELALGDLMPLDEAIPELRPRHNTAEKGRDVPEPASTQPLGELSRGVFSGQERAGLVGGGSGGAAEDDRGERHGTAASATTLGVLAGELARAAAAGDVVAVRVLHDAIARLMPARGEVVELVGRRRARSR
jgi:integrase